MVLITNSYCSYDESVIVISGILNSRAVMNASGCYELQLPAMRALTDKNGIQNMFLRTLQTIIKIREVLESRETCIEIDVSTETAVEHNDEHAEGIDNKSTIEYGANKVNEVRLNFNFKVFFGTQFTWLYASSIDSISMKFL